MKKILLTLFSLTLWGCQSIDQLSIDYLLPAEMSFPNQLRRVAVVNNVPDSVPSLQGQFTDLADMNTRSLYHKTQYLAGDAKATTESLAQALADGDYFDTVIICDSALYTPGKEETTLTTDEVNTLTHQLGADFLVSLENIQMRVETKAQPNVYLALFVGNTDVKVAPTVRIYIPDQKPRTAISKIDSIFWEGYGEEINEAIHDLPNQRRIVREASQYAGEFIAKSFVPYWETANRFYFPNGSVAMRDAAVAVHEDNWQEAVRLWESSYNGTKSAKRKMYAAYNLALGCEMQEKIEEAIDWATKAQQYAMQVRQAEVAQLAGIYLQQLNQRKQSFASVKMQMRRFEEDF